jgi:DNA polymerase-3 subunit gamma/tau
LSLLDQSIAHGNGEVRTTSVQEMVGTIDTKPLCDILEKIADRDGEGLLTQVANLRRGGVDFTAALRELSAMIQDVAIVQVIGDNPNRSMHEAVKNLADRFSPLEIQLLYQIALKGIEDMPFTMSPEMGFEMCLLRMLAFNTTPDSSSIRAPQKIAKESISDKKRTVVESTMQKATALTKSIARANQDPWHELVEQLPIRGLTQVLARHCELKEKTDVCWTLTLDKKQSPLLQPRTEQALAKALSEHLGQATSIRVEIVNGEKNTTHPTIASNNSIASPSIHTNPVSSASPKAENLVHHNREVQRIMQTFSGKLDDQRVVDNNT